MDKIYHFIIFEQNDIFKNETVEELLRERANYYINKDKLCDFWILLNPFFIKEPSFLEKLKLTNYCNKFKLTMHPNQSFDLLFFIMPHHKLAYFHVVVVLKLHFRHVVVLKRRVSRRRKFSAA